MGTRTGAGFGAVLMGLAGLLASAQGASAQKVTAVPQLDLERLTGTWYEVARYPTKFEKVCAGQATLLFAEGDKPKSFQMGTFCPGKNGTPQENDATGKVDKQGDGRLKLGFLWPFTTKYWVLSLGPEYDWALVGQPNRKVISVLSRTPSLDAATLASVEAKAAAQGFRTDKLQSLPKLGRTSNAENGKLQTTPATGASKP